MKNGPLLHAGLTKTQGFGAVFTLRSLAALSQDEKRHTLLVVPESVSSYWNVLQDRKLCSETSMIGTAISGIAMLDGQPPLDCQTSPTYQMTGYTMRRVAQTDEEISEAVLCARARKESMNSIILLTQRPDRSVVTTRYSCR